MVTVTPTTDLDLVRSVFAHPSVWPHISDDGSDDVEDWSPNPHPGIHYLAVHDDDTLIGCCMLVPVNCITVEMHSGMLPEYRGARTIAAAKRMLEWAGSVGIRKVMTWVPSNNRAAAVGAIRAGFTQEGRMSAAYLHEGLMHDLILFGVSTCPPPSPM